MVVLSSNFGVILWLLVPRTLSPLEQPLFTTQTYRLPKPYDFEVIKWSLGMSPLEEVSVCERSWSQILND